MNDKEYEDILTEKIKHIATNVFREFNDFKELYHNNLSPCQGMLSLSGFVDLVIKAVLDHKMMLLAIAQKELAKK